jgi:hypothetical protein
MRKTAIETNNMVNSMRNSRRMMNLAISGLPFLMHLWTADKPLAPYTAQAVVGD